MNWLQRQLDNVDADALTWPDWKKREVGMGLVVSYRQVLWCPFCGAHDMLNSFGTPSRHVVRHPNPDLQDRGYLHCPACGEQFKVVRPGELPKEKSA